MTGDYKFLYIIHNTNFIYKLDQRTTLNNLLNRLQNSLKRNEN